MRKYPFLAVSLVLAPALAAAQMKSPLAMTTDPADRQVMAEAAAAVAGVPDLAKLDAVLAKLPRPTPLRGMVQTMRAAALANKQDVGLAVSAIEDALRLLPDDPRPKLAATGIFTFTGAPQRAADLWLEASRESPDLARLIDSYVIQALIGRLLESGDGARADRINARLGEIGFSSADASARSATALSRLREAIRQDRKAEAIDLVTAIGDPSDLLVLYVDRQYRALWPRIAEWSGVDLGDQSRRYLEELRADWTASDDFTTATPYARRLSNLKAHSAIIGLFLPMFERVLTPEPRARRRGARVANEGRGRHAA